MSADTTVDHAWMLITYKGTARRLNVLYSPPARNAEAAWDNAAWFWTQLFGGTRELAREQLKKKGYRACRMELREVPRDVRPNPRREVLTKTRAR